MADDPDDFGQQHGDEAGKRHLDGLERRGPGRKKKVNGGAALAEMIDHDLHAVGLLGAFVDRHRFDMRHCAQGQGWLRWNSYKWQFEPTHFAYDCCRRVIVDDDPSIGGMAAPTKQKNTRDLARTAAALETLARAHRVFALTMEQLDNHPWLLNTPGGTVNLKDGTLGDHNRGDLLTKATACTPSDEEDCPTWKAYLETACQKDHELIAYLQRLAGYALTGVRTEHMLAFIHGEAGSGKNTFGDTVRYVLGDYSHQANMSTFVEHRYESHPTDLAALHGKRMVLASETEQGHYWNASLIKSLTGDERMRARFMRKDSFEFAPFFKLLFLGNYHPSLRSLDSGMQRRLHVVPFNHVVPEEERDLQLGEKLKAEAPGILRWMIQGCLEWQLLGLRKPSAVDIATKAYFERQDVLGDWLDAETEEPTDPKAAFEELTFLYERWSKFCVAAGERPGTKSDLSQELQRRGYLAGKHSENRRAIIHGIRLTRVKVKDHGEPDEGAYH